MEARPSFLGRGRGRGQRDQRENTSRFSNVSRINKTPKRTPSAWNSGPPSDHPVSRNKNNHESNSIKPTNGEKDRHKKAEEIRQAAAKFTSDEKFLDSSDSDEDVNDDQVLDNTLKTYQGDQDNLMKIKQYLQDSCHSRALTCLICIASVKHNDAMLIKIGCEYFNLLIKLFGIVDNVTVSSTYNAFRSGQMMELCRTCLCLKNFFQIRKLNGFALNAGATTSNQNAQHSMFVFVVNRLIQNLIRGLFLIPVAKPAGVD